MKRGSAQKGFLHQGNIFVVDGAGALLSGLLLLVVARFENIVGIPAAAVTALTVPAFAAAVYSLSCFLLKPKNSLYLLAIIIFNILYCCVTAALLIIHSHTVTAVGIVYFTAEIAVIIFIVLAEGRIFKMSGRA